MWTPQELAATKGCVNEGDDDEVDATEVYGEPGTSDNEGDDDETTDADGAADKNTDAMTHQPEYAMRLYLRPTNSQSAHSGFDNEHFVFLTEQFPARKDLKLFA